MTQFYTYIYKDPTTLEPFYVGKGFGRRSHGHLFPSVLKKKTWFYNKLRKMIKLGFSPVIEVTHRDSEESALIHEQLLIGMYGRKDNDTGTLLNNTDGGEGVSGLIMSEESREKQRLSVTETMNKPEVREILSSSHKTEEYKELMKGRCNYKPKFGDDNPMRKPEIKVLFSGKNNAMKRPEVKAKYIAARKGVPARRDSCPHCNVEMSVSNIKRFHFDNCPSLQK